MLVKLLASMNRAQIIMGAATPVRLVTVDDDSLVLDFIETSLSQPDVEISRSTSPEEGWELIRRIHPVKAGETIVFHAAAGGVGA